VEGKTFELLTKMYSEFSNRFDNVEKDIKGLEKDITGLKGDVRDLKSNVARIEIKLEHNIEPKIEALFEDRDIVHKKLNSIEQKIDDLTARVDKHDVEIRVIKGGKPKASKS